MRCSKLNYFDKFRNLKDSKISIFSISTILNNLIGAIFWFLIASIVGTQSYGEIAYFLAIATIASKIASLGSGNALLVYVPKGIRIQPPLFISTIFSSLLTAIIVYTMIVQKSEISLFIIGFVIFNLIINDVLGKKDYQKFTKYIILQKILLLIGGFGFYYIIGIDGVILGIGLSYICFIFPVIKKIKHSKIDFSILLDKKKFLINNYISELIGAFNGTLDKILIAPLFGFVLLGNFQLSQQFINIFLLLPTIMFQFILPHESAKDFKPKIKKIIFLVSILGNIGIFFLSPVIIEKFFIQYDKSIEIIQVLSFQLVPYSIVTLLTSKFLAFEKSKIPLVGMMLFLISEISLIFILKDMFGIMGVAFAIILGESIFAIYLLIMNKLVKFDISK